MKALRWTYTKETHKYMHDRQVENIDRSRTNRSENWMADKLKLTRLKWTRQAQWGYRLFDFWCHEIGVAIEVDGDSHDPKYDAYRDEYNFRRSGIVVLRVRNYNEEDADEVLRLIPALGTWRERREKMGIISYTRVDRRRLSSLPGGVSLLQEYLTSIGMKP